MKIKEFLFGILLFILFAVTGCDNTNSTDKAQNDNIAQKAEAPQSPAILSALPLEKQKQSDLAKLVDYDKRIHSIMYVMNLAYTHLNEEINNGGNNTAIYDFAIKMKDSSDETHKMFTSLPKPSFYNDELQKAVDNLHDYVLQYIDSGKLICEKAMDIANKGSNKEGVPKLMHDFNDWIEYTTNHATTIYDTITNAYAILGYKLQDLDTFNGGLKYVNPTSNNDDGLHSSARSFNFTVKQFVDKWNKLCDKKMDNEMGFKRSAIEGEKIVKISNYANGFQKVYFYIDDDRYDNDKDRGTLKLSMKLYSNKMGEKITKIVLEGSRENSTNMEFFNQQLEALVLFLDPQNSLNWLKEHDLDFHWYIMADKKAALENLKSDKEDCKAGLAVEGASYPECKVTDNVQPYTEYLGGKAKVTRIIDPITKSSKLTCIAIPIK
jgi:hypothetical protein